MRAMTADEHWSLHSGDARQVREVLLKYLRDAKTKVEDGLGSSTDQPEMMRLQGDRRTLQRLIEALEKDARLTTQRARDLQGLKLPA